MSGKPFADDMGQEKISLPEHEALRLEIAQLCISELHFARYIGVTRRTMQLWLAGKVRVPPMAFRVIELLQLMTSAQRYRVLIQHLPDGPTRRRGAAAE